MSRLFLSYELGIIPLHYLFYLILSSSQLFFNFFSLLNSLGFALDSFAFTLENSVPWLFFPRSQNGVDDELHEINGSRCVKNYFPLTQRLLK